MVYSTPLDFEPRVNILGKLPLELLIRVLEELHPVDLLAVARTNKQLYEFLRDKQNECVWRTSRRSHVKAEIPDPVQISEYAMASLLFDPGECMVCGNRGFERVHVWSYAYGERVCGGIPCRLIAESEFIKPPEKHASLICSLVRSAYFCNFRNRHLFGQCSGRHGETNNPASHRVCKKRDVEAILADLEAGFTEEQLREKYKSTTETRDRYSVFVRQLAERSQLVQTTSTIRASLREAYPKLCDEAPFRVKRGPLYTWLTRTKFQRNLPCDYVLDIFVEWYDPESSYTDRVKKIRRIRDILPEDLYHAWELDGYEQL